MEMSKTDKMISAISLLADIHIKTVKAFENASSSRAREDAERRLEAVKYLKELVEKDADTNV